LNSITSRRPTKRSTSADKTIKTIFIFISSPILFSQEVYHFNSEKQAEITDNSIAQNKKNIQRQIVSIHTPGMGVTLTGHSENLKKIWFIPAYAGNVNGFRGTQS
jgi:sporulation protein YlmC with PRC-barrel domain